MADDNSTSTLGTLSVGNSKDNFPTSTRPKVKNGKEAAIRMIELSVESQLYQPLLNLYLTENTYDPVKAEREVNLQLQEKQEAIKREVEKYSNEQLQKCLTYFENQR
jgi:hypothetical protein